MDVSQKTFLEEAGRLTWYDIRPTPVIEVIFDCGCAAILTALHFHWAPSVVCDEHNEAEEG